MSDLEQRLTRALHRRADVVSDASDLAAGARRRAAGRRRRRRVALAAAVAAAAVVVVGVLLAGLGRPDGPHGGRVAAATRAGASPGPAIPGYRTESWHDVTFEVPSTWGYGALDQWCAGATASQHPDPDSAVVQRPDDFTSAVGCHPGSGYGVRITASAGAGAAELPVVRKQGDAWPDGAWVGARSVDDVRIEVAAPEQAIAQRVLGTLSADPHGIDPNGCPARASVLTSVAAGVLVCRYDDVSDQLLQSERLTGSDATAATAALARAPAGGVFPDCSRATDAELASVTFVRVFVAGGYDDVTFGGTCPPAGLIVTSRGRVLGLTSDVLYWALSPGWSGGFDASVPMPRSLRQ